MGFFNKLAEMANEVAQTTLTNTLGDDRATEIKEKVTKLSKTAMETGASVLSQAAANLSQGMENTSTPEQQVPLKHTIDSPNRQSEICSQGSILPPPIPEFNFYAIIDGKQRGPYNKIQFKRLVDAEMVTDQTLVWRDSMSEWKKAGDVEEMEEFFPRINQMMPPPPPPIPDNGGCPPPPPIC